MSEDSKKSAWSYYGRLFVEKYIEFGGEPPVLGFAIDPEFHEIVVEAAEHAAKLSKSPKKAAAPVCRCHEFTQDYKFIDISVEFNCPSHGKVKIDRRFIPLNTPAPAPPITIPVVPPIFPPTTPPLFAPSPLWVSKSSELDHQVGQTAQTTTSAEEIEDYPF